MNESRLIKVTPDSEFNKLIRIIIGSLQNREREIWLIYFYPYCERVMKKYSGIFPLVDTLETIGKVNYYHHILQRNNREVT